MKKFFYTLTAVILFLSFSLSGTLSAYAETGPIIKSIEFIGNKKISDDTITSRIKSRAGDLFSEDTVRNDIKKLYGIGYFEDIQAEIDYFEGGIKLIFNFTEKPTIISLDFSGNEEYEAKRLKEQLTIASGAIANLSLITDNVNRIVAFYQSQGYWHIKVLPIIREVSKDAVAITFKVEEGSKVTIKKITIKGNNSIPAKRIKKVMNTKEWWIISYITGSGTYQKEIAAQDLYLIRELYNQHGYIYAAVDEPVITLSPNKKKLYMTISLVEGDQYKLGTVKLRGNTVFSDSEILDQVQSKTGQILNRTLLRSDMDRLIDMYMDKGYARADINPLISVNRKDKIANVTIDIKENSLFRIGRIKISGITKTRDNVIRREMRLDEGDIYSKKKITRSRQRINNLNYFDTVDLTSKPKIEEKLVDLDVNVKEKLTGMISVGAGYSSQDRINFMGEMTQANLFGRGLFLKLRGDFSSSKTRYNVTIRDPWFMDRPISASLSLYSEEIDFPDYDKEATGGSIGFGKELSEYVGGRIIYNIEDVEITGIEEGASSIIKEQEGSKLTSSISPSIWRDTRDSYLDPTSGSRNSISLKIAGLGGDNYFYKGLIDSLWYFPSLWNTTFSVRGRVGYAKGFAGETLPLYERFYVGGINTVRGIGYGEAGPVNELDEKIGGNLQMILNTEIIFPVAEDIKLKGVVFFDYGSAFDNDDIDLGDLRYTAGTGLRWLSPLGPIRVEWGYNIDPRDNEESSRFEFSMGGFF